ncbi:hydroxysteroid dehydrogenase-like protein 1 [Uranotaenia lowii]|uniref:hydroxysteroid dehydrogenase-like protein 1 n=1 Tax=Uranotaenia lowii TaxID=190385 RepID=UPI002479AA19|nr:hydroxysteroid dehydrogenase-like protein 1 [Uranotaenia lowii]
MVSFLEMVGIYALVIFLYESLRSPASMLCGWIFSDGKPLSVRYGKWAVITGPTDGIGKQYALRLAKKGLNIFLLARSEQKLKRLADEIKTSYGVEVQWMVTDFTEGWRLYELIENAIKQLDIGILVNNVGMNVRLPIPFDTLYKEEMEQGIAVNITSTMMMTHIVLPGMKLRERGLIINVSSGGARVPWALVNLYGSTKAFINSFSQALQEELEGTGVEVQLVIPMFVDTNMIEEHKTRTFHKLFATPVDRYGKHVAYTIGTTGWTTGYWYHGLQYTLTRVFPLFIAIKIQTMWMRMLIKPKQ